MYMYVCKELVAVCGKERCVTTFEDGCVQSNNLYKIRNTKKDRLKGGFVSPRDWATPTNPCFHENRWTENLPWVDVTSSQRAGWMRCVTLAKADAKETTERLFLYLTCNNYFLNLWLYVLPLKYRLNMGFEKKV